MTEAPQPLGAEFVHRDPLAVLTGTERPSKLIAWPGRPEIQVVLWRLTGAEDRAARLATLHLLKDPPPKGYGLSEEYLVHDPLLLDDEQKYQFLARALRTPDDPSQPFAPDVEKLRAAVDPDTREALFNEYLTFVDERSPLSRVDTRANLEEMVDALGKGSLAPASLGSFDRVSLVNIASSLVDRLRRLTSANSSNSTQPNDSSGP